MSWLLDVARTHGDGPVGNAETILANAPERLLLRDYDVGDDGQAVVSGPRGCVISASAGTWRSFGLRVSRRGSPEIALVCGIVEGLQDVEDPSASIRAHASWLLRVLAAPRRQGMDLGMAKVAATIAALAALGDADPAASVSCEIRHAAGRLEARLDSTGSIGWGRRAPQALIDHAASAWTPSAEIAHGKRAGMRTVTVGSNAATMEFSRRPDAMEGLRLVRATGVDPGAVDWDSLAKAD